MINTNEKNNLDMSEQVTLTFVQHSFVNFAYDENKKVDGYYFVDDELANTSFKFDKGHYLSQEDIVAPVLAHGTVSAEIAMELVGRYPMSWYKALCVHTTGNAGMDDLALALFIADYIEPSRRFMTDEKRTFYLGSRDISQCAYRVLCDMISHWREVGFHDASSGSLAMKDYLERKAGSTYE
jgi:hypothetical protein